MYTEVKVAPMRFSHQELKNVSHDHLPLRLREPEAVAREDKLAWFHDFPRERIQEGAITATEIPM